MSDESTGLRKRRHSDESVVVKRPRPTAAVEDLVFRCVTAKRTLLTYLDCSDIVSLVATAKSTQQALASSPGLFRGMLSRCFPYIVVYDKTDELGCLLLFAFLCRPQRTSIYPNLRIGWGGVAARDIMTAEAAKLGYSKRSRKSLRSAVQHFWPRGQWPMGKSIIVTRETEGFQSRFDNVTGHVVYDPPSADRPAGFLVPHNYWTGKGVWARKYTLHSSLADVVVALEITSCARDGAEPRLAPRRAMTRVAGPNFSRIVYGRMLRFGQTDAGLFMILYDETVPRRLDNLQAVSIKLHGTELRLVDLPFRPRNRLMWRKLCDMFGLHGMMNVRRQKMDIVTDYLVGLLINHSQRLHGPLLFVMWFDETSLTANLDEKPLVDETDGAAFIPFDFLRYIGIQIPRNNSNSLLLLASRPFDDKRPGDVRAMCARFGGSMANVVEGSADISRYARSVAASVTRRLEN